MTNHDQLFKQLLTDFFFEFIELFLPEVADYMDKDVLEFLDKEVFTDVTAGERHEVDLIVKTRFRGQAACFLLHVENQSQAQPEFAKRMFRYFSRLHERYDMPIYPIALLSYDAPQRPEPDAYRVEFPDKRVLDFSFVTIQLNRLNWRDFVRRQNPVASALMAKMKIAPEDRPHVKLECLRLLATLRLNPAKMQLISGFVDSYLGLTPDEDRTFQHEMSALASEEKETVMQLTTSWEQKGIHLGKTDLVVKLLRRRFGDEANALKQRIDALDDAQLNTLAEALLDFSSLADATAWLDAHAN